MTRILAHRTGDKAAQAFVETADTQASAAEDKNAPVRKLFELPDFEFVLSEVRILIFYFQLF